MIVSYRDKRTREFASGKRVKAFSEIERSAQLKLDRLEAATALRDLAVLPGNPERSPEGSVQHPHQRPVADLLRVARPGRPPRPRLEWWPSPRGRQWLAFQSISRTN